MLDPIDAMLDDYTAWLLAENLYDPILNSDAPANSDA